MSHLNVAIEVPGAELAEALGRPSSGLGSRLEESGAAYVVLGAERMRPDGWPAPNPTVSGTWLARRTTSVGLVLAASPQRDHPYNLARRLASVDHCSAGRAGWLALANDHALALGANNRSSWVDVELSSEVLADAITASRKLWRTWPIESLNANASVSGAAEIRYADHVGVFSSRGPLNSPTTPQGEPVVIWHWDPEVAAARQLLAIAEADAVLIDARQVGALLSAVAAQHSIACPQLHVRVTPHELLTSTNAAWSTHSAVRSLVLAPKAGQLKAVLEELMPALYRDGLVSPCSNASGQTLRQRLRLRRREGPDLRDNPLVFQKIEKEVT